MKYYVLEIATGDPAIEGKAVYEYNSQKEAMANYHTKLGQAMKSPLYDSALLMVIGEDGSVYATGTTKQE